MYDYYNPEFYCLVNQTVFETNDGYYINIHVIHFLALFLVLFYGAAKIYKRAGSLDTMQVREKETVSVAKKTKAMVKIKRDYTSKSCTEISIAIDVDLKKRAEIINKYTLDQEDELDYRYGGYIPLHTGDMIDCYEVVRKLGFGQFSTVWLCKHSSSQSRYSAVKILKSSTIHMDAANDEIKLLNYINKKNVHHPGYPNVVKLIRNFKICSVNGKHICLEFNALGPSLLYLIEKSNLSGINLNGVRNIIRQILNGLVYLHEECGIVHTDIKPENILIKVNNSYIEDMVSLTKQFVENQIPQPKTHVSSLKWQQTRKQQKSDPYTFEFGPVNMERSESYPGDKQMKKLITSGVLKESVMITKPIWVSSNMQVLISDFGSAIKGYRPRFDLIQTKQYRALEVLLKSGYSYPADVWSVGCLAFELATGEYLFDPCIKELHSTEEEHLALIWEALGSIPHDVIKQGVDSGIYFNDKGEFINIPKEKLKIWRIKDVLVEKYGWHRARANTFGRFIETFINPRPDDRVTAKAALKQPWFQSKSN